MSSLTVNTTNGAVLGNINGGADVYSIPPGSTITITPQRGFGEIEQVGSALDADDATTLVLSVLGGYGLS